MVSVDHGSFFRDIRNIGGSLPLPYILRFLSLLRKAGRNHENGFSPTESRKEIHGNIRKPFIVKSEWIIGGYCHEAPKTMLFLY